MKDTILEILDESDYAMNKWGSDFDDKNTINDWVAYMTFYLGKAASPDATNTVQRAQLIKVAGLAISALEAMDRNGRFPPSHYLQLESLV